MKTNISNTSLFQGLDSKEINLALEIVGASESLYRAGSYIFNEAEPPKYMYIVLEGKIILEKTDINGKNVIINTFEDRGDIFAEVYILLDDKTFQYSSRAIEDSTLLKIPKGFLDKLSKDGRFYDQVSKNLLKILASKAYHLNNKITIHSSYSLRQKIATYINQLPQTKGLVDLDFNRDSLADYLGSSRPSISRELSNMQADGLIRVNGNLVEIINKNALEELL